MSEEVAVLSARFAGLERHVEDKLSEWARVQANTNSQLHDIRQQLSNLNETLNRLSVKMTRDQGEHSKLWEVHKSDAANLNQHIQDHKEGRIEKSNRGNVWLTGIFTIVAGVLGAVIAWLVKP